jgi:hypothetical protein
MHARFNAQDRQPSSEGSGLSLIWMSFPSVTLVMVLVFMAVQILSIDPDTVGLSFAERMDVGRLAGEFTDNLPFMLSLSFNNDGPLFLPRVHSPDAGRKKARSSATSPATTIS